MELSEANITQQIALKFDSGNRKIEFSPNLPFIYLPEDDFIFVSNEINKLYRFQICDGSKGY